MGDSEEAQQRRSEAARRYKKKNAKQISAYGRQYRAEHAEQIAEYKRAWRERNGEHLADYRGKYGEENREKIREANREYMRRQSAKERAEIERRERKAEKARERYHADIEASRAKAREYLQQKRAEDPDAYREGKKRRNAAWRKRHKDEINSKLREKNLRDPSKKKARAQRDYERHGDERRASRRRSYQKNRDRELAKQKQWRDRERRRIEVGLPVRRLHKVAPEDRGQNAAAAAAFFAREVTQQLREQLKAELATPQHLIDALRRDWARIRAVDYARRNPETSSDTVRRRESEEVRLDAIARDINDRLRQVPRRDPQPAPYLAYQPPSATDNGGLGL
ncbi:hypothetical protein IWX81_001695 [Salinibacterium sp. CAN_S4]|uniref:hypothetical protein n=1 Tax=Salinibacterium sp. CAN_S4 TaxID=2787727 RepID=UPI0018F01E76